MLREARSKEYKVDPLSQALSVEKKTASQCRRVSSNVIKVEYKISLTILEEENSPTISFISLFHSWYIEY